MKNCPACGFPAPPETAACAYCGTSFSAPSPTAYRLEGRDGVYRWWAGGAPGAIASWSSGMCHLRPAGEDTAALTLVPVANGRAVRVAIVDAEARLVCTLVPDRGPRNLSTVCDRYEQPRLLVRGDGPTGVHVIDPHGNVMAIASRDTTDPDRSGLALDVLVVRPNEDGELVLFGVVLATELLRTGELRPVG